MSASIVVWVPGEPKGQPRPRAYARNGHAKVYDPGTSEGWKASIAATVAPHLPPAPLEGPVSVEAHFVFPRPKRLMRPCDPDGELTHLAKPDSDNAIKAVLDILTRIGLWRDDSQVCDVVATKRYAAKEGRPGMRLRVTALGGAA